MAHEALAVTIAVLGAVLLLAYYFGPRNEVRQARRMEGKIMLIPTGLLLFAMAAIIFSGLLG